VVGKLVVNAVNEDEDKRKGGGGRIPHACPNPLPHIIPSDHPHLGTKQFNLNNYKIIYSIAYSSLTNI